MTLASSALLSGPAYWYLLKDPAYRTGWYTLLDHANRSLPIWQIEMTRWSFFGLHIILQFIISRRLAQLAPRIFLKLAKWSELNTAPLLDPLKSTALQRATELMASCSSYLFNCVSCISLYAVTRHLFYRNEVDRTWQYFLERTTLMATMAMAAILIEKIVLHLLAIEFNRSLYQERVFKSMYSQWALSALKNFLASHNSFANVKGLQLNSKLISSPSLWKRKIFPHRNSDDLISAFLLENASLKSPYAPRDQLLKQLFKFFDPDNSGVIELKMIQMVFGDEDARKVQLLLSNSNESSSNNSRVSSASIHVIDRDTLKKAIQAIHQDRWDLNRALTTHASIIKKLDRVMIGFIVAVILYFSPIVGFQMDKSNILNVSAAVGPLLFSFQELFGDSLKRFCEAIIYIVTCHPYDIGDRVSIDGVDFYVHKIGLVSTTFKRFDGFMVWIPNYSLSKKALCNIRRTGMQGQRLEIHVDASVPLEKLQILSTTIKEFIKNDTKDFEAVTASFYDFQLDKNFTAIVFILKHRFNFQDGVQRAERQNRFLLFLKEEVGRLGIDYKPPVMTALLDTDEQIRNHLVNLQESMTTRRTEQDPFTSL